MCGRMGIVEPATVLLYAHSADRSLETEFQAEAELPFVDTLPGEIRGPRDGHEVRSIADITVRVGEVWCVGEIERLRLGIAV